MKKGARLALFELRHDNFFLDGLHYYNSFLAPTYAIADLKKMQALF